jgi:hypothetical protein
MNLLRLFAVSCFVVCLPMVSIGDPPAPPLRATDRCLPAGKWRVEFANGVIEDVAVKTDATAQVSEPARSSGGKVVTIAGTALVVFDDDRVERWTKVGGRMVVEHWFPAAQFPNGTPVRGIADIAE